MVAVAEDLTVRGQYRFPVKLIYRNGLAVAQYPLLAVKRAQFTHHPGPTTLPWSQREERPWQARPRALENNGATWPG